MDLKLDNQLHILNGDAIVPEFRKSGIEGAIVVWREALCDGPIADPIREDSFWDKRAAYIKDALGGEHYEAKMISELDKIRDLSRYEEVVLWFEYDLFCQANMLACLNFIDHNRISLVCLGDELDGTLRGLGEIAANDFITLYHQKTRLSREDLQFARTAWEAYTDAGLNKLQFIEDSTTFKHLKPAIQVHITRLPGANGLNALEEKMLRLIKAGVNDERRLIGTMLKDQGYFGLGDMQYFHYLNQIRTLLKKTEFEVNDWGNKILDGKAVFPQPKQYIGGVFRPDFYQKKWGQSSNC